jgi:hypothetical protein
MGLLLRFQPSLSQQNRRREVIIGGRARRRQPVLELQDLGLTLIISRV